jgi:hypothetical protein
MADHGLALAKRRPQCGDLILEGRSFLALSEKSQAKKRQRRRD